MQSPEKASSPFSSSTESLNSHEISVVEPSEVSTGEESADQVEKILYDYAKRLAAIDEKRLIDIQEVETRANNAQAVAMMKGMRGAVSSDIEAKKTRELRKIEQQRMKERTVLFIQAKKDLLEYQQSLFKNIFENYSSRLTNFPKFSEKFTESQKAVEEVFIEDKRALNGVDLDQERDDKLHETLVVLLEHDVNRLAALKPLVRLSINSELNKIEKILTRLEGLIKQSRENSFIDQQGLILLRDQFIGAKEAFFVAEAIDCNKAREVAVKNISDLQASLEEVQAVIERASEAAVKARPGDKAKLNEKIELLQNLAADLTLAQEAWRQIEADSNVRIKTKNLPPSFFDLNILSALAAIPTSQDHHWMVARRGEIEVVSPRELTENRKLYREANDLIRLAVFRDFGSDGLKRFDAEMKDDLNAENPLTVAQIKRFVEKESSENPPAFYLSPVQLFEEVIFSPVRADDEMRVIKGDLAAFKMFSTSLTVEAALSEEQKKELGFNRVREAFVDYFKKLPEANRLFMLKRFDDQFSKASKEKKALTVQNVRKFFNAELTRQQSSFPAQDIIGPVLSSVASNVGTLLLENITSLPIVSSLGPIALLLAGVAMGVSGDMNTMWQELRGRHPRNGQR